MDEEVDADNEDEISTIGGCELISQIGEGAMGQVYKGRHTASGRIVAVKILTEKLAGDPLYIELFQREGLVLRELHHTHIVEMLQYGEEAGILYCVMEFVDGENLATRIKNRRKFAPVEALGLLLQAARGLEYAWVKERVIHRDIKPANLLLRDDGVVKVVDFGLAKPRWQTVTAAESVGVMGTPYFLSPEQATGDANLDFRCDVYGLGVTLYQFVTGQVPFTGATASEVMHKHLDIAVPDPRKIDPMIGRPVIRLIQKMMAKDRNARHSSYGELLTEMEMVKKTPVDKGSVKILYDMIVKK